MGVVKDLSTVSKEEFFTFLNSFSSIFCNVDGVLVLLHTPIPGSVECIESLRKLDKKIFYVTNNSSESSEYILQKKLKAFNAQDKELFSPLKAMISYLENTEYDKSKSLYVIGSPPLKNALKDNGYTLVDFEPSSVILESFIVLRDACLEVKDAAPNIGGVIVDFDFNFSLLKGSRATVILRANPDLLFLSGISDHVLMLGDGLKIPGSGFYIESIERITKRKSVVMAKPGEEFGNMVNQFFAVEKPERVLFIGDSLQSDMLFATKCGYQKLLVLTGVTSQEQIKNWPASEDSTPQYYIKSLDDLNKLIYKFEL